MSEISVLKEFQQFGERFFIIAILMVLSIFVDFLSFIALIVFFFALANIKRINVELQDKNLKKFRSKIKDSIWVSIVGIAILGVAGGIAAYQYMIEVEWMWYLIPINIAIYGIILLFKAILIQKKAWHKLNKFFVKNRQLFPDEIVYDALDGTDKLEKACKYTVYIITIPIAVIYGLIGLFKLAKLRHIPINDETPEYKPTTYKSPPPVTPPSDPNYDANYCISCGNKRERKGRFCALCGYDMGPTKAFS